MSTAIPKDVLAQIEAIVMAVEKAQIAGNVATGILTTLIAAQINPAREHARAMNRERVARCREAKAGITSTITDTITPTVTAALPAEKVAETSRFEPVFPLLEGGGGVSVLTQALVLSPSGPGSDLLTKPSGNRRRDVRLAPLHPGWSDFRTRYPRREAWPDAEKAWDQVKPPVPEVMAALDWQIQRWNEEGTVTKHIPLPASWLRGKRWTDERPAQRGPTIPPKHRQQYDTLQANHAALAAMAEEMKNGDRR